MKAIKYVMSRFGPLTLDATNSKLPRASNHCYPNSNDVLSFPSLQFETAIMFCF